MIRNRDLLIVAFIIIIIHFSHAEKIVFAEQNTMNYGYETTGINNNLINDILIDGNHVWIATSGGIKVFNKTTQRFAYYPLTNSGIGNHVSSITKFQNAIWCGIRSAQSSGGIGIFQNNIWTFQNYSTINLIKPHIDFNTIDINILKAFKNELYLLGGNEGGSHFGKYENGKWNSVEEQFGFSWLEQPVAIDLNDHRIVVSRVGEKGSDIVFFDKEQYSIQRYSPTGRFIKRLMLFHNKLYCMNYIVPEAMYVTPDEFYVLDVEEEIYILKKTFSYFENGKFVDTPCEEVELFGVKNDTLIVLDATGQFHHVIGETVHDADIKPIPQEFLSEIEELRCLAFDDNTIWVGTNWGLLYFNGQEWQLFRTPDTTIESLVLEEIAAYEQAQHNFPMKIRTLPSRLTPYNKACADVLSDCQDGSNILLHYREQYSLRHLPEHQTDLIAQGIERCNQVVEQYATPIKEAMRDNGDGYCNLYLLGDLNYKLPITDMKPIMQIQERYFVYLYSADLGFTDVCSHTNDFIFLYDALQQQVMTVFIGRCYSVCGE